MNWQMWKAKRLRKRIDKYEYYILKVMKWMERDKKELKLILTNMDDNTLLLYGDSMGLLDNLEEIRK